MTDLKDDEREYAAFFCCMAASRGLGHDEDCFDHKANKEAKLAAEYTRYLAEFPKSDPRD